MPKDVSSFTSFFPKNASCRTTSDDTADTFDAGASQEMAMEGGGLVGHGVEVSMDDFSDNTVTVLEAGNVTSGNAESTGPPKTKRANCVKRPRWKLVAFAVFLLVAIILAVILSQSLKDNGGGGDATSLQNGNKNNSTNTTTSTQTESTDDEQGEGGEGEGPSVGQGSQPTSTPTGSPTEDQPTGTPGTEPSPSAEPATESPTTEGKEPTLGGTEPATEPPTSEPTTEPPTSEPATEPPTSEPATEPTTVGGTEPAPTPEPATSEPSPQPTPAPTPDPTPGPTDAPQAEPTNPPTPAPTDPPQPEPTPPPQPAPTNQPTKEPTKQPTKRPTRQPTKQPTPSPTPPPQPAPTPPPTPPQPPPPTPPPPPPPTVDENSREEILSEKNWLNAHNSRRSSLYSQNGVSNAPLRWSSGLEQSARNYANKLISLDECQIMHGYDNDRFGGENLAMQWNGGGGGWTADNVLQAWFDDEQNLGVGKNGHFTQVGWRATEYVGCAEATKELWGGTCYIQVCRYVKPGNCNLPNNMSGVKQAMLNADSPCEPNCPPEGCPSN